MSRSGPPSALPEEDYDAIEAAVMETARGRWFLAEYARRNRTADTGMLLEAIAKLQAAITDTSADDGIQRFRKDLIEMAEAIAQTRREIASMRQEDAADSHLIAATGELDAIVEAAETATGEILSAAEQIQELAWTLREEGANAERCDALDAHATNLYMACSFQDLTGQRTQKVVKALRFIEDRINSMVNIWQLDTREAGGPGIKDTSDQRPDAHLLNGPQLPGQGSSQSDVDEMLDDLAFIEDGQVLDIDSISFDAVQDDVPPPPDVSDDTADPAPANVDPADAEAEMLSRSDELIDAGGDDAQLSPSQEPAATEHSDPAGNDYDQAAIEHAAQNAIEIEGESDFDPDHNSDVTISPLSPQSSHPESPVSPPSVAVQPAAGPSAPTETGDAKPAAGKAGAMAGALTGLSAAQRAALFN